MYFSSGKYIEIIIRHFQALAVVKWSLGRPPIIGKVVSNPATTTATMRNDICHTLLTIFKANLYLIEIFNLRLTRCASCPSSPWSRMSTGHPGRQSVASSATSCPRYRRPRWEDSPRCSSISRSWETEKRRSTKRWDRKNILGEFLVKRWRH